MTVCGQLFYLRFSSTCQQCFFLLLWTSKVFIFYFVLFCFLSTSLSLPFPFCRNPGEWHPGKLLALDLLCLPSSHRSIFYYEPHPWYLVWVSLFILGSHGKCFLTWLSIACSNLLLIHFQLSSLYIYLLSLALLIFWSKSVKGVCMGTVS